MLALSIVDTAFRGCPEVDMPMPARNAERDALVQLIFGCVRGWLYTLRPPACIPALEFGGKKGRRLMLMKWYCGCLSYGIAV